MADPAPTIFDEIDTEAEDQAWAEGEQAANEGRVVSHKAMSRWLLSWGTAEELPPPKCDGA